MVRGLHLTYWGQGSAGRRIHPHEGHPMASIHVTAVHRIATSVRRLRNAAGHLVVAFAVDVIASLLHAPVVLRAVLAIVGLTAHRRRHR